MPYTNINTTEGLGTTVNVALKGTGQVVAGTIDQALSSTNGLLELLAIGVVLAAVAFVINKGAESVRAGKRLF